MRQEGGDFLKRSEFEEIVNTISNEEFEKLKESVNQTAENDENKLANMIANIATSIPTIAARTTAKVLIRSGVISLEDD